MDNKKLLFLSFVVENIAENPEWLPDLTLALNRGLSEALSNEREKAADLASGFAWLVKQQPKTAIKYVDFMEQGLRQLSKFYENTPIQKKVDEILEYYKEE